MAGAEPKVSVDKAALGASLPGATGHVISRLLFRWLLLPAAIVLPAGGAAGLAWRLAHLRASAEDVAAAQAAVEKATDEAEAEVDEALRSQTDPTIHAADSTRARRSVRNPKTLLEGQLKALAATMVVFHSLPSQEEELRRADEARRQGHWQEAITRYSNVGFATEKSDPRTAMAARLGEAELLLEHGGDRRRARYALGGYLDAARAISPEVEAEAARVVKKALLQARR